MAADSSGRGNNGLYTGDVGTPAPSTQVPMGPSGNTRSRLFDRAQRHAVRLANMPAAIRPASELTFGAWYRATSVDTSGAEIISGGDDYVLRLRATRLEFAKRVTSNGTGAYVVCFADMTAHLDGAWHHLAAVTGAGGMALYFDGQAICTNMNGQALRYDRGPDFWVGRHGNGSTSWDFAGNIDDVRVYDRALTATEVQGMRFGNP
jgi:hypothetical protein